ncbi:cytochrome C biogenesis protein [bacterium]|nr:cytochrome C biogenesis protein [bacterium]
MMRLFESLTMAIEGAPAVAMSAALFWGILSVLLSPCHLASIPLIVGFIDEQGNISTKRAFWLSTLFALGILATIALIGVITGLMGRLMGDLGNWGNYLVSGIFILFGLHLMGIIPLPFANNSVKVKYKKKGLVAALILGLVFGLALGPCTFAFMAPMIGVAFKAASADFLYGATLLFMYGIGHCAVIVVAGTSMEMVTHYLHWNQSSHGAVIVKKICGILVILGGVYLLWRTF